MAERVEYKLTIQELETLLDACKHVPAMMVGEYITSSPQENANRAWAKLGKEKGFDSFSVQPVKGKGPEFFTAIPL